MIFLQRTSNLINCHSLFILHPHFLQPMQTIPHSFLTCYAFVTASLRSTCLTNLWSSKKLSSSLNTTLFSNLHLLLTNLLTPILCAQLEFYILWKNLFLKYVCSPHTTYCTAMCMMLSTYLLSE